MSKELTFKQISKPDLEFLNKKAQELDLKPEQIQCAHYFALPKAYRPTQKQLGEIFGVDQATIHHWQYNRRLQSFTRELMKCHFFNDLPDILEAMRVKALQGSETAAKLVIEYIEDFMQKGSNINIKQTNIYASKKDVESRIIELKEKLD